MIDNLQVEDIDALIKHGQVCTGKFWRNVFIGFYIAASLFFVVVIGFLIGVPLTLGEFTSDLIITIICLSGGGLFVFLVTTLVLLHCRSIVKKAELFLKDAVLLEADTKSLKNYFNRRNVLHNNSAIEVSFIYNDVKLCRRSEYKGATIYLSVFNKYVDKSIHIAYSPAYDEVMFIKPESIKKLKIE